MNKKAYCMAAITPLIAVSTLSATDKKMNDACAPTPPAPCYSVETPACCDYCLGPINVAGNPAVRPYTCDGDFVITVAGFYWNAHQDGLEYAVDTSTTFDATNNTQVNIIEAHYKRPNFHWEPGFKLGVGYNTTHDGWDVQLVWTWYRGRASSHSDADSEDNHTLLPLWSAFQNPSAGQLGASDVESHWKLHLDLVDLELGREFWSSKYLTLRPFIGLRYALLDQKYKIEESGDSFNTTPPVRNEIEMKNKFNSIGVRGGLDSVWHVGRGFSLFGNLALSLLYGRFHIDQNESNRITAAPFSKTPILDTDNGFHTTKAATDLTLGVQYQTMFCDCRYGFLIGIGWEHHMFFNQNQLWRVNRVAQATGASGENVFNRNHGDLSTQGWTLNIRLDF